MTATAVSRAEREESQAYVANLGGKAVPTLCILNVGTVPTLSPSELVHLNDLHYLSLEADPPQ